MDSDDQELLQLYQKSIYDQSLQINYNYTRYTNREIAKVKSIKLAEFLNISKVYAFNCPYLSLEHSPQNLTECSINNCELKSISGIEKMINLISLELKDNNIADISPLKSLTKIEILNLQSNQIQDISILENLSCLEKLYLNNNKVNSLQGLGKQLQLRWLNLQLNQVTNIEPLSSLLQLKRLILDGNQVEDIGSLCNMNLEEFGISNNKITSIEPLKLSKSLNELNLARNQINNIFVLSEMYGLRILDLESNIIEDITPLKGKYIYKLLLGSNNIQNILPLAGMEPKELTLQYNEKISDYSILRNMTDVKYLDLSSCKLQNASFLHQMTELITLKLSCNKINDIAFVRGMRRLHHLDLSYNSIIDLTPLQCVDYNTTIYLHGNRICDMKAIKNHDLHNITLNFNYITDYTHLDQDEINEMEEPSAELVHQSNILSKINQPQNYLQMMFNRKRDFLEQFEMNMYEVNDQIQRALEEQTIYVQTFVMLMNESECCQ
ncbi:leucine-rich_repeat domain-containing protein [Hexamita inflata]|uniref:Leucine-rich repeat domain-containing protein n=1 Tax=Hexamita inflata TaxID=28002 RepID=A0AA86TE43_9EUKA|nr:leucine-rich repeat domain-containing protein [Hexamita inflata]